MSCKVKRMYHPEKGGGLWATAPLSPGEELYVAEPFVYTVKETMRGYVCEFCLVAKDRLLRCSQCKYAKYCSKPCQTKAWPDHKRECKCLDNVFASDDRVDFARLAIRAVFKIIRNTPCPSESLYSMSELCASLVSLVDIENYKRMLVGYMKEEIAHPSELSAKLDLAKILPLIAIYCRPILNDTLKEAGIGMYPNMCLLTHSCEPNCSIAFMGSAAHLRAIKKIQTGERLTIAWVSPTQPTEQRQSMIRSLFGFDCCCRRCETRYLDESMLAGDKQASDQTRDTIEVLESLRSKQQWKAVLLLCDRQLKRNAGRVPDKNIYQMEILRSATEACMVLSCPKEGLPYGYRALKTSRMYTSGITHESAELLMIISVLELLAGNESKASKIQSEVVDILELFLGGNHPLPKDLKHEDKSLKGK